MPVILRIRASSGSSTGIFASALVLICMMAACSTDSGTGVEDPDQECADETQAFVDYIQGHLACEDDADCQAIEADCLLEARAPGECSGRIFVNNDATASDFSTLNEALRDCLPESRCGGCATDTYLPACNDGTCGPGAEIPDE